MSIFRESSCSDFSFESVIKVSNQILSLFELEFVLRHIIEMKPLFSILTETSRDELENSYFGLELGENNLRNVYKYLFDYDTFLLKTSLKHK